MIKFPHVPSAVRPLYEREKPACLPQQRSVDGVARRTNTVAPIARCRSEETSYARDLTINVDNNNVSETVIKAKMYEPVADGCVTILTRFTDRDCPSVHSEDESHQKEIKNNDNKTRANIAPEKPPRRIKLQKLHNQRRHLDKSDVVTADDSRNHCTDASSKVKPIDEHHVDLEDVNRLTVESENYKNRFQSTGVQVSPLPPYRLRILPISMRRMKSDPEKCDCGKDRLTLCCTVISRWMFSQIGLAIIIIIWALLGAAAFHETEGPREREQAEELATLQYSLAISLATELRQVLPHEPVWPSLVQNYFAKHETLLLNAVSAGYGEGGGGGHIWTYPGCLLFAVSLLTTLGFGAPVPRTTLGRGAAVLFSAIGIPLHFLLVLNIGVLIASKLQNWVNKRKQQSNGANGETFYEPLWLKWLPVTSITCYYILGIILFGFARQRSFTDSLLFPLDFTATGGVAKTLGHVRIFYALYLEVAVTLAATMVSLLQVSAASGLVNLGLKLGLLTNS